MSTIPNVRDLLEGHITLELESIDRLYLNGYVPQLQHGAGLVQFFCQHRGQPIASPALLGQITGKFVAEVESFATQQAIPLFHFEREESKTCAPIKCAASDQCAMRCLHWDRSGKSPRLQRSLRSSIVRGRSSVLRGSHSRQPGLGSARSNSTDFPTQDHPHHTGEFPHTGVA